MRMSPEAPVSVATRLRALLRPDTASPAPDRPRDLTRTPDDGLTVLPSPLDGLKAETRRRLGECAGVMDITEQAALSVAVHRLWMDLRAQEAETDMG